MKRIDANHREIVAALRGIGASVQSLADVGKGTPDLLVGYRGVNYLFEVKDGAKCKSATALTDHERKWHETWRGNVKTVFSAISAINAIQLTENPNDRD